LSVWVWAGQDGTGGGYSGGTSSTGKSGERAGTRVLVVDDDASILDTVTSILSAEGFAVVAASGGEQALGLLSTWHPTLVLLDMRMPLMDGWTVARKMRELGARVPIVVMTAAENAKKWADEIGAAGHIAKPFVLDDLIAVVERHARQRPN
jgi:DNA-binding response OmpR family regulator